MEDNKKNQAGGTPIPTNEGANGGKTYYIISDCN